MKKIYVSYMIGNQTNNFSTGGALLQEGDLNNKHWIAHAVHNWEDIEDLQILICRMNNLPDEKHSDVVILNWKMIEDV